MKKGKLLRIIGVGVGVIILIVLGGFIGKLTGEYVQLTSENTSLEVSVSESKQTNQSLQDELEKVKKECDSSIGAANGEWLIIKTTDAISRINTKSNKIEKLYDIAFLKGNSSHVKLINSEVLFTYQDKLFKGDLEGKATPFIEEEIHEWELKEDLRTQKAWVIGYLEDGGIQIRSLNTEEVINLPEATSADIYNDHILYGTKMAGLWCMDLNGQKEQIFNMGSLYDKEYRDGKQSAKLLWQYEDQIYFSIDKHNTLDSYYKTALYRYDLKKRENVYLGEETSVFDHTVKYNLEPERGSIIVEYLHGKGELHRSRIEAMSGSFKEEIEGFIDECGEYVYEITSVGDQFEYFICEYNKANGDKKLICKIDANDYYNGFRQEQAIKVGDAIYFTDYTHYLTPKEIADGMTWPPRMTYCKVNIKTKQVNRITQTAYETQKKQEKVISDKSGTDYEVRYGEEGESFYQGLYKYSPSKEPEVIYKSDQDMHIVSLWYI